ncbi:MAG: response regulator [Anaerolineales bacterium]|nr:response regulator [Anaerolineales bacterium]
MQQRRVLIVDDTTPVRVLLQHTFRELMPNYHAVVSPNGAKALDELQQQSFDLILTDYDMPDMDGLELAQKVRQILPDARIVLMSCIDFRQFCDDIEKIRIDGYLKKPFNVTQLLKSVEHAMGNHESFTSSRSWLDSVKPN